MTMQTIQLTTAQASSAAAIQQAIDSLAKAGGKSSCRRWS